MIRALGLTAAAILIAACGSKAPNGPCDVDPPDPACMQPCDPQPGAPNTCPAGFYCSPDGLCTAQCTQGGSECGSQAICTPDGHCMDVSGDANVGPDANCPDVTFTAMRVTPTVQLLIDRSGSMNSAFSGATSRWAAMADALVGPMGVVYQYEASVYFGATLYDRESAAVCPRYAPGPGGTGRALNNGSVIDNLITSNGPGGGTPTAPALTATHMDITANPPPAGSPPIIILATDGQPFLCAANDNTVQAQADSIAAAQAAFAAGIRVFVLGLAPAGDPLNDHLQRVANAGAGQDPQTGTAPYYPADNAAALAMAFDTIIGGVVSCDLMLDGDVTPAQAANGRVYLNGVLLTYGSDWTLVGTNIIRLIGTACQTLQGSANPMVTATFPCGAIID